MNVSLERNIATALISLLAYAGAASADDPVTVHDVFDRLKGLEGTWQGTASGGSEAEAQAEVQVTHVFEASAAGTVVMETMNPESPDHEMINMYHLDGNELVLTHYCASGNQPTMKLAQPASVQELRFDFTGGTNLDPAKDVHIHAAHLVLVDADTLESSWTGYKEGKEAGVRTFLLKRADQSMAR